MNRMIGFVIGTLALGSTMGLLPSCSDRYSMHANGRDARLYRLDRFSGAVDMIEGKTMTRVTDTEREDAVLDSTRDWGEKDAPGTGGRIQLATKWRNGQMFYRVRVAAADSSRGAGGEVLLTLYLVDRDGFKIDQIAMETSEADMVTRESGAPWTMVRSGWHPMDSQTYRKIAGWTSRL